MDDTWYSRYYKILFTNMRVMDGVWIMKLLRFIFYSLLIIGYVIYVIITPFKIQLDTTYKIISYVFGVIVTGMFCYEFLKKEILGFFKKH